MAQALRTRREDDFTLRIVVTAPESERVVAERAAIDPTLDEEGAPTKPFRKAHLLEMAPRLPVLNPHAEPLSVDEFRRLEKREAAVRRIAWAKRALERLFS